MIQAFFTHLDDFDQYATIDYAGSVVHLIPPDRSIIQWPPGIPIHEDGADYVALTMDRLAQSPKVLQVR